MLRLLSLAIQRSVLACHRPVAVGTEVLLAYAMPHVCTFVHSIKIRDWRFCCLHFIVILCSLASYACLLHVFLLGYSTQQKYIGANTEAFPPLCFAGALFLARSTASNLGDLKDVLFCPFGAELVGPQPSSIDSWPTCCGSARILNRAESDFSAIPSFLLWRFSSPREPDSKFAIRYKPTRKQTVPPLGAARAIANFQDAESNPRESWSKTPNR